MGLNKAHMFDHAHRLRSHLALNQRKMPIPRGIHRSPSHPGSLPSQPGLISRIDALRIGRRCVGNPWVPMVLERHLVASLSKTELAVAANPFYIFFRHDEVDLILVVCVDDFKTTG